MAGWAGFTDEDLKQIKQTTSPGPSTKQPSNSAAKQAMARKQKIQQQRELARQRAQDFARGQSNSSSLPLSPRLSQPNSGASPQQDPKTERETLTADESSSPPKCISDTPKEKSAPETIENNMNDSVSDVKEIDEKEAMSIELSRIEQFRAQQKKMEEENKQRRRVLADAIKQRSKLAKEEAEKLTKVQKELSHLDSLVTADVAIIRNKIEAASMDFLQAQKRYERAEKEFVEAKIALADKSDLKESLTEHLYTVIQQNEVRKAERLAVLMKELGLEGDDSPTTLTVPPLMCFSPINTLHRPHFPPTSPSTSAAEASAAPESVSETPSEEQHVREGSGEPQEQADKQCENKESPPGTDAVVSGSDISGKADGNNVGGKSTVEGEETEKEKCTDSQIEPSEKSVEVEKQKAETQMDNGNPESQDGGADTAVVS